MPPSTWFTLDPPFATDAQLLVFDDTGQW